MTNLYKGITRISLLICNIIIISIIVNISLYAILAMMYHKEKVVKISTYSDDLILLGDTYYINPVALNHLEQNSSFAILINKQGVVTWSHNKPSDIPDKYSLTDVASFSRWYLKDYPVDVWTRDDGLFVLAYPRLSRWKQQLNMTPKSLTRIPLILLL
ncbi:hypothetical protein AN639_00415 [Candidatus Epulonipiscium fishelsonii]|uniref:Uncharacterized protein n=1 Tax=Candidatus Epulonipiscium fishelsonii TaxID=77094 RepID=A0ACC8XCS2_9FIRM|nr:hypothetical protein AN396_05365 [Epulopiscium sp. SCG-B11WGA-EpuloA1]ONI41849.1 hypothetical protein AN639_00415 [Epulopiscium sp. SCG-B05WGA-EpuloA1]